VRVVQAAPGKRHAEIVRPIWDSLMYDSCIITLTHAYIHMQVFDDADAAAAGTIRASCGSSPAALGETSSRYIEENITMGPSKRICHLRCCASVSAFN
jgi:hypothetical protein